MEIYWFAIFLGIIAGVINNILGNPAFSLKSIMTILLIVVPGCVIYYRLM